MDLSQEYLWRPELTFDYGECMGIVSEDVHDTLQFHSERYTLHMEALERLSFRRGQLDHGQMHAYIGLMSALSELESVVSDRMWAGGVFSGLQCTAVPGFSLADFWQTYLEGWRTKTCVNAMSAVEDAYNETMGRFPETFHQQLLEYEKEKLQGVRIVADTTAKHGFEFAVQLLEEMDCFIDDKNISIFYGFFPNETGREIFG